ncbi:MAG: hypothetical protein LQ340_002804 [Diploschistes diacapsis]|nr:MAG: hypothetical protein LQ340_002804 [Diploschistes diacapsis]
MADFMSQSKRMKQPLLYYEWGKQGDEAFPIAFLNWGHIVSAYSGLALSFSSDKFPAISGVAQEYQKTTQSRYVAGMWEEHMLGQLLWFTEKGAQRPPEYRAPTWSWASVDGPVVSTFSPNICKTWQGWRDEQRPILDTVLAEVLDVQVSLVAGEIETGRIQDGSLRMRGRLIPVLMAFTDGFEHKAMNPFILEFTMQYPQDEDTLQGLGYIYADICSRRFSKG